MSTKNATEDLPDCSVGVMNLGFDHIPRLIDIFRDVKHRQRHGASEPQQWLSEVEPWAWTQKNSRETNRISYFGCSEKGKNQEKPFRAESTKHNVKRRGAVGNNETETLTNPPTISKDRRTRIWLGMISQEPFRIEFQRIGVSIRVV
jgi:hypothetical protein